MRRFVRAKSPFIIIFFVALIAAGGFKLYRSYFVHHGPTYEELVAKYPLLSKRILTENENDLLIHFVKLRQQLRQKAAEYGDSFAFYFEYLPTGIGIGVNEKVEYDQYSLLKLPLVMAYYNQIEDRGIEMGQPVAITQADIDTQFGLLWQQGAGAQITLDDAARLAITESDNTAARVVARYVNNKEYTDVYNGLDIELPPDISTPVKLSAKGYSSILKALYFSSILNHDHSELILILLTNTQFRDKLPAGVPAGIPVAHKIGVLSGQVYQDCGIVYEPLRPYILCLFSKSDEATARTRMQTISSMVYSYVHGVK